MKWGGRKNPSPSSSRPSLISKVSPFSWLSKFKQMRINSEPKPAKLKQNYPTDSSPGGNRGRFYGGDDDAFWRISFGEEGNEPKKSEDILQPVSNNLDAKRQERRKSSLKFKQKEIGLREESEKELEYLRRRYERKAEKVLQEQLLKLVKAEDEAESASNKSLEKNVMQCESPRTICTPRTHSVSSNKNCEKNFGYEKKNMKQTEDLKTKSSKQRQSLHVSREIQRRKPKVRVHSPRMASKVEIHKIKAIEEKKKAKMKMKKEEERAGLDSFAVVKCSLDPQQDFRDSMIEMIIEKQISQPEEMEELLACYLTLNSNEYHHIIIKVFKQVWLCMSQASFDIKSQKQ